MKIAWNREFSIKNVELDKQHQMIFEIANQADVLAKGAIKNPNASLEEELKRTIFKLFEYIKEHFKDEEEYMESIGFPMLEEHKHSHIKLTERAKAILKHIDDKQEFSRQLSQLTKDWIVEHFAEEDAWILNYTKKSYHLNECHYTLPVYIKLKAIKFPDIYEQEVFDYICNCPLRIHSIPDVIHQEIALKGRLIRCSDCQGMLVRLKQIEEEDKASLNYQALYEEILSAEGLTR